jgi:hypothetical protein
MQANLADIELSAICINQTFATDKWSKCNYDYKSSLENKIVNSSINHMQKRIRDLHSAINDTKNKILSMTKPLLKKIKDNTSSVPFIRINDILISDSSLKDLILRMKNSTQKIQNILSLSTDKNLTNYGEIPKLRDNEEEIRTSLGDRETEINNKVLKVSSMFENFQTPVGTIPIGFQELVALFPFIISILFLFFAYSLFEAMNSKSVPKKKESFIVSLLFDPYKAKKSQKLQIALLLIPISVFVGSLIVTMLIDFAYDEPSSDTDDPFRAAVDLNKLIYVIMSILALILILFSLRKLSFFSKEPVRRGTAGK